MSFCIEFMNAKRTNIQTFAYRYTLLNTNPDRTTNNKQLKWDFLAMSRWANHFYFILIKIGFLVVVNLLKVKMNTKLISKCRFNAFCIMCTMFRMKYHVYFQFCTWFTLLQQTLLDRLYCWQFLLIWLYGSIMLGTLTWWNWYNHIPLYAI